MLCSAGLPSLPRIQILSQNLVLLELVTMLLRFKLKLCGKKSLEYSGMSYKKAQEKNK